MPNTPFTNVVKDIFCEKITMPKTPNGTLDPTVIYQDDSGDVHCQKKDLSAYRKLFAAAGTSEETNAVVIQSSLNTTNSAVTTNSTDIGDNGTDITTNTGDISTLNSVVTALGAQNDATVWWLKQTNIDFTTAGSTPITIGLPTNARVVNVKFVFDGSDAQRTPQAPPTLTVEFTGGAAATMLDWTSAAGITIPEHVAVYPQYTLNDGGAGSHIQVTTSQTTFNATPAFTILVGILRDPLT